MAVFSGTGEFTLTPRFLIESAYLQSLTGGKEIKEVFDRAVFVFTDRTYQDLKGRAQEQTADPNAQAILREFRDRMRVSMENPRSVMEAMLRSGGVDNLDAEILTDILNPAAPGFFSAYMHGKKYNDLRFHVNPRGVFPGLPSLEEVALVNLDPQNASEGILYLTHLDEEFASGKAASNEDRRSIETLSYNIHTTLGKGDRLAARAQIRFRSLIPGDRVLKFDLLPNLRVSRITHGSVELPFIQEDRKQDSGFYVILPAAMEKGREYQVTAEYEGDKVVRKAGGGTYSVGARTSWYPSINAFSDRATYDLTFTYPKDLTLVSIGKQTEEKKEGDFNVSRWVSEVPLAVAGFNYGKFKRKDAKDEKTNYNIEVYATTDVPDYLRAPADLPGQKSIYTPGLQNITPSALMDKAVVETTNSVRLFSHWFGPAPYGRVAITQQPEFSFGQSWPSLIYLPMLSFLDSTQRWGLLGVNNSVTDFVQEVTPHEVAHQWWGHVVGWRTYHDQWLSEGFADFSASLYLQATEKPGRFVDFWEKQRDAILEKNEFGRSANDAGPIWLGQRLHSFQNPGAYSRVVYNKGSYVLHMLRMMMQDQKTGDQRFIEMMREFVKTYHNQTASTLDFKRIVDKYVTPDMDVSGNKTSDWFFANWVYGTEIPRYRIDYTLTPASNGNTLLKGTVSQTEVSNDFTMIIPIYLELDGGKLARLGRVRLHGASSMPFEVALPLKPKRVLLNAFQDVLARK